MPIFSKYSSTLVLSIVFFIASAQKNKEVSGFIITQQNDTILCVFKKNNWKKQPKAINARLANKDTVLSAKNVAGVIIPSLKLEYVSRLIRLTNYIDKVEEATREKDPPLFPAENILLKVLHKGNLNLYEYTDQLKRNLFFAESRDTLAQLYNHHYSWLESLHFYIPPKVISGKNYQLMLQKLMMICPNLYSIIGSITLEKDQLLKLFDLYEKCTVSKE